MSTKLNVGCGGNFLAGFINKDIEMDITKPLPYKNNSVDFILAEHVVEHVSCADGFRFMEECFRVLRHGGILRICVPELARLDRQKRKDIIINHGHMMVYNLTNLTDMLTTAGFDRQLIAKTKAKDIDGHHKVIGRHLDNLETLRVEATK